MKRLFAAALFACTAMSGAAQAHFIDGYLGLCSAVGTGTCTELTSAGYARQPVFFSAPVKGVAPLGNPVTFGLATPVAGRAIYDAPTAGNLLMVMPATTTLLASGLTYDVGALRITITAMLPYQFGEAYIGKVAAATAFGLTTEGNVLSSGVALDIFRGDLTTQGYAW